ncbi:MAG: hypothetical protein ACK5OX_07610, partial [Desertimonas sp.]
MTAHAERPWPRQVLIHLMEAIAAAPHRSDRDHRRLTRLLCALAAHADDHDTFTQDIEHCTTTLQALLGNDVDELAARLPHT